MKVKNVKLLKIKMFPMQQARIPLKNEKRGNCNSNFTTFE